MNDVERGGRLPEDPNGAATPLPDATNSTRPEAASPQQERIDLESLASHYNATRHKTYVDLLRLFCRSRG